MSMSVNDKARLYRELGKLLTASFPMDKAVVMLRDQRGSGARLAFLDGLNAGLTARQSFSDSMKAHNALEATPLERSLIEAGEKSGHLAQACEHLARYFETSHRAIKEARGALIYPLLLLHVGIIIPQVAQHLIHNGMGQKGASTSSLIWAIALRLGVFWLLIGVLSFVWKKLTALAGQSEAADRALGVLPLIGRVRRHWALARFCQVFHSTLLAGMRITECLRMAGESAQSALLKAGATAAAERVEAGETLATAMRGTQRFQQLFVDSVATAEASGGLDLEMERWAKAETSSAESAQQRAAEWYPKALYFVILIYIAARIIGFFTDYFGEILDKAKMN